MLTHPLTHGPGPRLRSFLQNNIREPSAPPYQTGIMIPHLVDEETAAQGGQRVQGPAVGKWQGWGPDPGHSSSPKSAHNPCVTDCFIQVRKLGPRALVYSYKWGMADAGFESRPFFGKQTLCLGVCVAYGI